MFEKGQRNVDEHFSQARIATLVVADKGMTDEGLTATEAAHLASCASCRREFSSLRADLVRFGAAAAQYTPPAPAWGRSRPAGARRGVGRLAAGMALACVALLVLWARTIETPGSRSVAPAVSSIVAPETVSPARAEHGPVFDEEFMDFVAPLSPSGDTAPYAALL